MDQIVHLEGFHALKHALRFNADIIDIMALRSSNWHGIAVSLAPDVIQLIEQSITIVDEPTYLKTFKTLHPTGIGAVARRPAYAIPPAGDERRSRPAILLEEPRRLGNVGAAIRVAAAADASSVLTTGPVDPWGNDALRGSAGLHFALPVERIEALDLVRGPIIAMDPTGIPIKEANMPANAVLAFGTERDGLSDALRDRADQIIALPMRAGVSSLNLATSVAATLYSL